MNCYTCGIRVERPYAIWRWQSGKPDRIFCWLCYSQCRVGLYGQHWIIHRRPFLTRLKNYLRSIWTGMKL